MKIKIIKENETVNYAADELKKYIVALSRGKISPEIIHNAETSAVDEGEIVLGLLSELGLDESDLDDAMVDDIIDVKINDLTGYIAGSNPRSILMGVYRYCESLGVRYLRPGENGDYIPASDPSGKSFEMRKKADYPFRGECCEGAISYEHMRDTVYWLPKIGMNMYMIEGTVPYTYMHKWYGHVYNTKLRRTGQVTDYNMLLDYVNLLERDVKRCGLQLHTLGHDWMFRKMGIRHADDKTLALDMSKISEEDMELFAEVGGKRGLFGNSPFYTHFCYSNPRARKLMVDTVLEYLDEKPHVDFVHTWLADSVNNQCECAECQKHEPSDWFVIFLNELDDALTARDSEAKIIFIAYVDTVRPPREFKLNNPKRFILVSAMGGFYEEGYKNEECTEEIPPFERNNFVHFSAPLRMKCHRDWKAICDNIPSFIYEYRYYTDMYCDLSQMRVSYETSRDMKALTDVNFNGCISDQTHRMYMPTGLPLITMGNTLFDKSTDFETLKNEHFAASFGNDATLAKDFLDKLSVLLSPANFRVGGKGGIEEEGVGFGDSTKAPWVKNPYVAERASKIPALIEEFAPTVKQNIIDAIDPAQRLSWMYLDEFLPIARYHGAILKAGGEGNMDKAREIFAEMRDYISENELKFHNVFDLFLYLRAVSQKIGVRMPAYYD